MAMVKVSFWPYIIWWFICIPEDIRCRWGGINHLDKQGAFCVSLLGNGFLDRNGTLTLFGVWFSCLGSALGVPE
jgi:hypothetical protein